MPELPDVEVFRKYLDSTSLHQKIQSVQVKNKKVLKHVSPQKLEEELTGRKLQFTTRHGKLMFSHLDDQCWLLFHFGMTGYLKYFKHTEEDSVHDRVVLNFANGYHLAFICQRMLGEVDLVKDREKYIKERGWGPDALEVSYKAFVELFRGRRGSIKSALMNQKIIAGIGNIYSDEILFQSRVYPQTEVKQMDEQGIKKLFQELKKVLNKAVEFQVNPDKFPDSYLLPRRGRDGLCPRCNNQLQRLKITGRTAYFCPHCQT